MKLFESFRSNETGLLRSIPVMGPVLQSILAASRLNLIEKLYSIVDRLENPGAMLDSNESSQMDRPDLVSAILLADAEARNRLSRDRRSFANRFLYLAANQYASAIRTYEIASQYGFLWRSFHKKGGTANPNVMEISVSDLVVLGYREPNIFHVLLPLRVTASGEHTLPIDSSSTCHDHSTFVFADDHLSDLLEAEGYRPDPEFGRFCGLSVEPLLVSVTDPATAAVLGQTYPSPGMNSIWKHDQEKVSIEVRDWIAGYEAQ